jgi:integrase
MKLEQLPSGSYRVRKMVNGVLYRVTFDHKPSQKEITLALAEVIQDEGTQKGSFYKYAQDYIKSKKGVLSPATIRTYTIKLDQLSDSFKNENIFDIDSNKVQREISFFSMTHAPKTTKTLYGFISSVLTAYRPSLKLRVTLPQNIAKEQYEPKNEDIKLLLKHVENTPYSVPFQLGILGCRRGEICAASIDDLDGNNLWIHKSKVYDGKWIVKESPKTDASNRIVPLPDSLADQIRKQGYIYNNHPNALNKAIHRYQKQLGIPQFKFHALRSYFASYAHSLGIPDADIMAIGGWETDHIMKRVYRKSLEESKRQSMNIITENLF